MNRTYQPHEFAQCAGVTIRTLDKALWQHSKERALS